MRRNPADRYHMPSRGERLAPIQHQEPPIVHQEPPVEVRTDRWPRRPRMACPKCRNIQCKDGGQAVVIRATSGEVAYLRCKVCQNHWKTVIDQ